MMAPLLSLLPESALEGTLFAAFRSAPAAAGARASSIFCTLTRLVASASLPDDQAGTLELRLLTGAPALTTIREKQSEIRNEALQRWGATEEEAKYHAAFLAAKLPQSSSAKPAAPEAAAAAATGVVTPQAGVAAGAAAAALDPDALQVQAARQLAIAAEYEKTAAAARGDAVRARRELELAEAREKAADAKAAVAHSRAAQLSAAAKRGVATTAAQRTEAAVKGEDASKAAHKSGLDKFQALKDLLG